MTAVSEDRPLVVDLDGTFFLVESFDRLRSRLLRRRPHRIFGLRRRRRRGKDVLKLYLWEQGLATVDEFPVNRPLLDWLEAEHRRGREIVLATGSAEGLAEAVVSEYPVFSDYIGTTHGRNLTGSTKAAALVERFGERGFDYVGNSRADLEVWQVARGAVLCNVSDEVRSAVPELCPVLQDFGDCRSPIRPSGRRAS